MKTLASVLAKIEALQIEAEQLRERERKEVIARIIDAIKTYEIQSNELFRSGKPVKKPRIQKAKKRRSGMMKGRVLYTDGKNDWSGYGPKPTWLRDHLERGATLDQFLVKPH